MEEIKEFFNKPLLKFSIKIGLITGLLGFAYFIGLYLLGITPLGNIRVPDFGIYVILMAFGCWYYRKTIGKGMLHLWEALTICYVTNMVGAFIAGWLIYFFITFVDPTIFTEFTKANLELLMSQKEELVKTIGEADFQGLVKKIETNEPSIVITDEISKKFFMGILPILIISLIFRKQAYNPIGEIN